MSLLPVLLDIVEDMQESLDNASRGNNIGDIPLLFVPQTSRCGFGTQQRRCAREQWRTRKGACHMKNCYKSKEEEDFQVAINMKSFKPDEISVKVKESEIIVDAKHEEREDEHGFVSRHFTRRYILPKQFDSETISTSIDDEGIMKIKALKLKPVENEKKERIIPIERVPAVEEANDNGEKKDEKEGEEAEKK